MGLLGADAVEVLKIGTRRSFHPAALGLLEQYFWPQLVHDLPSQLSPRCDGTVSRKTKRAPEPFIVAAFTPLRWDCRVVTSNMNSRGCFVAAFTPLRWDCKRVPATHSNIESCASGCEHP